MNIKKAKCQGIRITINDSSDEELGHGFLFVLFNDKKQPFGLMEDIFVNEKARSQGLGTTLVKEIIETAKKKGCYKLIATSRNSRPQIHEWYRKIGFEDYGKEFRMNF